VVDLSITSTYFQLLPDSPGAWQCALRLRRAFPGALESTCIFGGAFRILQDLTITVVEYWRSQDLCTCILESFRAAESSAKICRRTAKVAGIFAQLYRRLGDVFSQQWFLEFHPHMEFHLSYLS
jgi:hypothetical protein